MYHPASICRIFWFLSGRIHVFDPESGKTLEIDGKLSATPYRQKTVEVTSRILHRPKKKKKQIIIIIMVITEAWTQDALKQLLMNQKSYDKLQIVEWSH